MTTELTSSCTFTRDVPPTYETLCPKQTDSGQHSKLEDEATALVGQGGCDWEQEHGLSLSFLNGLHICKVGPNDGHPTNAAASGDSSLLDLVYKSMG